MRTRIEILRDIKKTQSRSSQLKANIKEIRKRMRGEDADVALVHDAITKTDELNEAQSLLTNLQQELEVRKRKGARHLRKKSSKVQKLKSSKV